MSQQHTPGPWFPSVIHQTEGGATISAGVNKYKDGPDRDVCRVFDSSDVALIAAAPEMLAVLEQCLPFVDAYRRVALGEGDIAAANARAVIAKAKGKS